jgi:hypothetical protein
MHLSEIRTILMLKKNGRYCFRWMSLLGILLFPICGSAQLMLQKTQGFIEENLPASYLYSPVLQTAPSYKHNIANKLGIFCVWEDRIIERSRVPIHFRLGTLEYTNNLEYPSLPTHQESPFYKLNSTPNSP